MLQIHYIRVSFARSVLFAIGLALVALVACSSGGGGDDEKSSSSGGGTPSSPSISSSSGGSSSGGGSSSPSISSSSSGGASGESSSSGGGNPGVSSGSGDIDVENAVKIEYKNGSDPVITNPFTDKVKIAATNENVVVTISDSIYNFVLSGSTSNGSLKIYGDFKKGLYLNGVNITNSKGSAINIQNGKRVNVNLVNGTQNFLTDASGYKCSNFAENEEQAKGTFFSEGKLEFKGNGSLEVKGKCNHAIVADNDIEIESGKITVSEAVGDGIHANDKIEVKGGDITIKSKGDGIQSEKEAIAGLPEWNVFSGGKINIQTPKESVKSHGIVSEGPITIKGTVDIAINVSGNGSKGIKSKSWVEFLGGKTSIETSGEKHIEAESDDESSSTGLKLDTDLMFNGGELTIKTTGAGAKGVNIEKNATIKGGNINVDAKDDGIKIKGILKIESGTVNVKAGAGFKQLNTGTTGSCSKTGGTIDFQCGGT